MPMILDELVVDADMLDRVAQDKAADIVHIKLSRVGGITKARMLRDYCITAGLTVSWATSGGTEIADSAAAHIACSTPEANLFAMWTCREFNKDRFSEGGPELVNGTAIPTQLPGLGVLPDFARLGTPIATFR